MSPTILRINGYRFFFFSREESRMHIHVMCQSGEAKFWLSLKIESTNNYELSKSQINEIRNIIEENYDKFKDAWKNHNED